MGTYLTWLKDKFKDDCLKITQPLLCSCNLPVSQHEPATKAALGIHFTQGGIQTV